MTCIYVLRIPEEYYKCDLNLDEKTEKFPASLREKIKNTKNKKTVTERFFAYSLLFKALNDNVNKDSLRGEFHEILYNQNGKPYLDDISLEFSISHTDGAAAIMISDGKKVGIDIEKINPDKKESLEKIIKKYAVDISKNQVEAFENIRFYSIYDGEIKEYAEVKTDISDKELLKDYLKWTSLEAVLKCDGGGFSSIVKAKEILETVDSKSTVIKLGNRFYALSAAES